MPELGSTSIDDLPLSPQQPQQQQQPPQQQQPSGNKEQTNDLNQFISGIQQASAAGMTALPARDIPREQTHITADVETRANYIPEGPDDYIRIHQSNEDIMRRNAEREDKAHKINDFYDEFSLPLMLGVLYFLFQMPIVRKKMFKFLPMLFNTDGNPNLQGYIVNSTSFALLCFLMLKAINYMGRLSI